jgi:hypothetical protein
MQAAIIAHLMAREGTLPATLGHEYQKTAYGRVIINAAQKRKD